MSNFYDDNDYDNTSAAAAAASADVSTCKGTLQSGQKGVICLEGCNDDDIYVYALK